MNKVYSTAKLPSVTQILQVIRNPSIERWRGDVGNEAADDIMKRAMSNGTSVHSLVEYYNTYLDMPKYVPPIHVHLMLMYAHWFREHVREVLGVEQYYTSTMGYGGKFDMLCVVDNDELAVVDVKTSRVIGHTYGLQLAAYANLVHENTGRMPTRRIVVQLRDGQAVPYEFTDLPSDLAGFSGVLELYHWMHRSGMWDAEYANSR